MKFYQQPFFYVLVSCFVGYGFFLAIFFSFVEPGFAPLAAVVLGVGGLFGAMVGLSAFYWYQYRFEELLKRLGDPGPESNHPPGLRQEWKALRTRLASVDKLESELSSKTEKISDLENDVAELRQELRRVSRLARVVEDKFRELSGSLEECRNAPLFSDLNRRLSGLVDRLDGLVQGIEPGQAVERLGEKSETLDEIVADYRQAADTASDFLEVMEEVVEQLSQRFEELEKIAINAGVEGARLGEAGEVVSMLAEDIQLETEKGEQELERLLEAEEKLDCLRELSYVELIETHGEIRELLEDPAGIPSGTTAFTGLVEEFHKLISRLQDSIADVKENTGDALRTREELTQQLHSLKQKTGSVTDESGD